MKRLIAMILVLAGAGAAGCNIVGPAAAVLAGPPTTDAMFELDEKLSYVIVVDDLKSRVPRRSLREEIAKSAEETLLSEGTVPEGKLISGRVALRVSATEDEFGTPLSVAELGQRVGADAVIYVAMERWTLSRDGGTLSPSVAASVKIIDAKENRRIWPPAGASGYRLLMEPQMKVNSADLPKELAQRSQTEQAVAKQFGVALAQMFYEHETKKSARR